MPFLFPYIIGLWGSLGTECLRGHVFRDGCIHQKGKFLRTVCRTSGRIDVGNTWPLFNPRGQHRRSPWQTAFVLYGDIPSWVSRKWSFAFSPASEQSLPFESVSGLLVPLQIHPPFLPAMRPMTELRLLASLQVGRAGGHGDGRRHWGWNFF